MRFTLRFTLLILHLLRGLVTCAVLFPLISQASQHHHIQRWSRRALKICGLRVQIVGRWPQSEVAKRGLLVVSNHISWLDIYAIHTVKPVRFIAKSEIRGWPLVGWLCDKTGTIFIERGSRKDAHRIMHHMAELLREGHALSVFPEGTTSDGLDLLPFHANLYAAAVTSASDILPVSLAYLDANGAMSTVPAYIGDMSLIDSIRLILAHRNLTVQVTIGEPIDPHAHAELSPGELRRWLAQQSRDQIAALRADLTRPPVNDMAA